MIDVAFVLTKMTVGGQERVVLDTIQGLDRSRFRPHVYCLKEAGALAADVEKAGADLHERFLSSKWDLRVVPKLVAQMRRDRIRVVEAVGRGDSMFWGAVCGTLAGVPAVVSALHSTRDPQGNPVIGGVNRLTIPMVDRYIVLGDAHKDYFAQEEGVPAEKMTVIYNGVDYRRFDVDPAARERIRGEVGVSAGAPVIGIVAVLRSEKAHGVLLRAAKKVLVSHPDAVFAIVGEGVERPRIESQVAELGLQQSVKLLGLRRDVPEVLSALDVAVLCSDPVVETFSISILEYMSAGKPVVSTRVGSVEELVKENETAFLVPPQSPDELADALNRLLDDPEMARQMGKAGRERVERFFGVENMVRAREGLYGSLLKKAANVS